MKIRLLISLFTVLLLTVSTTAVGAEKPLVVAFRGDAATLDPHLRSETTTMGIQANFYDRLVTLDPDLKIVPDLAESWKVVDDLTWEFKLRKGIRFHNGEPFTAEAAAYSLKRAKTHKKSQFKAVVPNYKDLIVVDAHTLRVVTVKPEPEALLMLTNISMVPPKYFAEQKDTYLAIHPVGTGAYKFVEWVKDDHLELVRNDEWHHGKADYQRVLIRPIPEDATRVAALISGEVDVCWGVPIPDIPRIEKNKDTYISRSPSARVIYLMFDVFTDKGGPAPEMQPGLPDGKPNPFKDIRVRKAIARAINIQDIIDYVMEGSAYPATQIVSSYSPGFNQDIQQAVFDPDAAKKLLAEAGYADGFKANFDSPNDRYINDQQVAEAITAQLRKVGIHLNLVAQPKAVFFPKISKNESPMFLVGWGMLSWTGTMNNFFRERKSPYGRNNRGRFTDKALEARIEAANTTMDDAKREKLRHAIMADAMASNYVMPLYYQENVNGYGNRVKGKARVDEYIYAYEIHKAE